MAPVRLASERLRGDFHAHDSRDSAFPATLFAAPAPLTLALNWKPEPQFGGFYNASLLKEDESRGVKFQILEGGSGTPTVQMLANGRTDLAIVSAEEILISNDRNPKNPVVGLFAVYQTNPQMIMCRASRGFSSLKDVFAGEGVLAWQSGLTYAQFLSAKYPKAKVKRVPYLGGIANYVSDEKFCQQGFATSEPIAAEKAGIPAKVFLIADEGFNPYTTVVAVREETLKKNPDLVKKAIAAIRAGWEKYLTDPKAANAHMGSLNKSMDAETFAKSAEAQVKLIRPSKGELGAMTDERWSELIRQLRDLKVIKGQPAAGAPYRNL